MGKDNAAVKDKPESHVVVEEADGGVYPTTAAVTKETMSETQPGSQNGGEGQNGGEDQNGGDGQAAGSGQKSENTQDGGNSQESAQTQGGNKGASKEEGSGSQSSSGGASQAAAGGTQRVHVVQDGETLYGICISEYHDVNKLKEICELNGLEDENKIVSGQKLLLP